MSINLSKFKSKLIRVDSSKATEYLNNYKTSFVYTFDPIQTDANESIVYSLINISIPYSYYSTNRHNQYLDVSETVNNVTTIRNLIIPAGNYSAISFQTELLSLLNIPTITYDIKYNKVQNRYTIAITTPNATSILLFDTGANNKESCYKFLGFNKVDVNISHNPLLSTNCVTMSDIYYLQLITDLGTTTTLISDGTDGILETINIPSQPFSILQHTPIEINRYLLPQKTLRAINISLLDNFNNQLNLNGLPFYCVIKIEIINNELYRLPITQHRTADEFKPTEQTIPQPINISDLIDYNNITRMLNKINK